MSTSPATTASSTNAPYTLILLRHGESVWNAQNLFTGWVDVDLTDKGRGPGSSPTSFTPRSYSERSRLRNWPWPPATDFGFRSCEIGA